jgi:hypothetical protein
MLIASVAALAACAPDSVFRDREFEAWLGTVRTTCGTAPIGTTSVETLLRRTGTTDGKNFLNATSRLYAGRITEGQWTSLVTAFVSGRPTDAGVRCVLELLPRDVAPG